jgi:hypothetical protein
MQVSVFWSDPKAFQGHELPDLAVELKIENGKEEYYWFFINQYSSTYKTLHGPYESTQKAIDAARNSVFASYWILEMGKELTRHGPFDSEEQQINVALNLEHTGNKLILIASGTFSMMAYLWQNTLETLEV